MSAAEPRFCARCGASTSDGITDAGEDFCRRCASQLPPSRPLADELNTLTTLSHRLPADTRVIHVDDAATMVVGWSRAVARAERERIEAGLRRVVSAERPTLLDRLLEVVHARDDESLAQIEAILSGDRS